MEVSSQKAGQVEGHVQAQMDIVLEVNESAGDPLGLEIIDESQEVDSWMMIKYDFDQLNHTLEVEPGEVYMVFEKYGTHKLDKINGRWFLELKILKSEWEAIGNNLAYEFQFISKNKVKAYKPPVKIIKFDDLKPVVEQLIISTTKILTYEQIGKAPLPAMENNPIVITHISSVPPQQQKQNITQVTNYYSTGGSGSSGDGGYGGGSYYSGNYYRSSDIFCYQHYVWNCNCRYWGYYQQSQAVQQTRLYLYDHIITQYHQEPEFQKIIPIITHQVNQVQYKKQQKQLQAYQTVINNYRNNLATCEPEAVEYIMSQVKYEQEQKVELISTKLVKPIEECQKLMERLIESPEMRQDIKDKLQKIKEVENLKPQKQTMDQRKFQLALLSKRWGKLWPDRAQQFQIEQQIHQLLFDLISEGQSDVDVKLILGEFLRKGLENLSKQQHTLHSKCHEKFTEPLQRLFTQPFEDRLKTTELYKFFHNFTALGFDSLLDIAAQNNLQLCKDPMKPNLESTLLKTLMIYASLQSILNEGYASNINIYCEDVENCPEFSPFCNEAPQFKFYFSQVEQLLQLEPIMVNSSVIITASEIQNKKIKVEEEFVNSIKQLTSENQKLIDIAQIVFDKNLIDNALLDDDEEELNFEMVINNLNELQNDLVKARSLVNHSNVEIRQIQ